jgi:acyl-coenzyme A synthetase/AMP-(fatty) acid ligase
MTQRPRMILSAGGPLTEKTSSTWQLEMGRAPTEIFGSSETGVIAWRRQDQSHLWQAFAGIHVQADASQALLVTSPLLGSLHTLRMEDVVEILPDQRFVLKGRLDRTIKLEEKRLFLPDMENRLIDHPGVDHAVLVLLTGTRQTLGAVVLLNKEGRQQLQSLGRRDFIQSLKKHLVLHFEQVLIPKRWRFPQALPFNERGKLAADAIQSLFAHENR